MRKTWPVLFSLLLVGCAAATPTAVPTITPLPFATATLAPTATSRATATSLPPTIAPTIEPVSGTLTTQVNVRAAPDAGAQSLGLLNYAATVQVLGKDESGKWVQVVHAEAPNGLGWISAQYVQLSTQLEKLPVISVVELPAPTAAAAEAAQPAATATPDRPIKPATTTQIVNVRSGPGTTYEALGMLDPGVAVIITGRNETSTWLQIEFPAGSDTRGWVAALYLKIEGGLDGLPYYDNLGNLKSAPSVAATAGPSPTPTIISPAEVDRDSREKPAASVAFSPDGTQTFSYSSDVSAPSGDADDWLAFTPYASNPGDATYVYITLKCTGNGNITPELRADGLPVPDFQGFTCGQYDVAVRVLGGTTYLLGLRADGSAGDIRYVKYELTIKASR